MDYEQWLSEVAKSVHLTPEQVESRAGDEPHDAFHGGSPFPPSDYAKHFVIEALDYFGEQDPETDEYASMDGIRAILCEIRRREMTSEPHACKRCDEMTDAKGPYCSGSCADEDGAVLCTECGMVLPEDKNDYCDECDPDREE